MVFKLRNLTFLVVTLFLMTTMSMAERFTSQYTEFELPGGWNCQLEGTEWVCQASNKDRRKEAIIILGAKKRGSQDSLDRYQAYLKKPKNYPLPGGKVQVSEGKYTKITRVNNHQWVDSLHMASEVPGFYTRYLATVKADLGVLVTFSVGKDHYASYQPVFDKIVETLRVFRQTNADGSKFRIKKSDEDLLAGSELIDDLGDRIDIGQGQRNRSKKTGSGSDSIIWIIVAVVGVLVVVKMKKGKKGKTKKKKSKK